MEHVFDEVYFDSSGDSRVGPEQHPLVTVQLQIRASQHMCPTQFTVIDEIGVNTQVHSKQKKKQK